VLICNEIALILKVYCGSLTCRLHRANGENSVGVRDYPSNYFVFYTCSYAKAAYLLVCLDKNNLITSSGQDLIHLC
jgi:hypothetical protein